MSGSPSRPPSGPRDPQVPADITWFDLDPSARKELRSLPKEMAERVGAHLAAAGILIDSDPESARAHAGAAKRLAARVAIVREAVGLTAYACGDYDAALADLRAYRRLSGDQTHLPVMADCERGLNRPERALEMAATPEARQLSPEVARELAIVVAGARADLGQLDAALLTLEADPAVQHPEGDTGDPMSVRVRYAYADLLERAGREGEAREWFGRAADGDTDGLTDAVDRRG